MDTINIILLACAGLGVFIAILIANVWIRDYKDSDNNIED